LPAAIAVFTERIKREWLGVLDLPDQWRDPIVLVWRDPVESAPPVLPVRIVQIGPVVKYEIDLHTPPSIQPPDLARAIVHALSLELANRDRRPGAAGSWTSATIPLWLTEGLTQIVHGQPDWLVAVARRGSAAARPATASDLLAVSSLPAEPAARELFTANAWLLTDGLRRLPNGSRRLQQFHAALARGQLPATAFGTVYGDLFADTVTLEKWWSLQQSQLANVAVPQNYTAAETSRRLDAALTLSTESTFRQLERYSEDRWLKKVLPVRIRELELLHGRAHPLYRPVILAYRDAAVLLLEEKISRFRRAGRAADQLRADLNRQLREIDAVVDQAERRANAAAQSELTAGYLRALESVEQFEHSRRNPIRDYLDQFDQ
jgi:hypothetical protein